jgi:hypothetical protein
MSEYDFYVYDASSGTNVGLSQTPCLVATGGTVGYTYVSSYPAVWNSGAVLNLFTFMNDAPSSTTITAKSYINRNTGSLVTVSDPRFKYSLRKKDYTTKDYLNRIMQLNIHSYCFKKDKDQTDICHNDTCSQYVYVGVLSDQIKDLFPGCLNQKFHESSNLTPPSNPDILMMDYQQLTMYFILAFQQFVSEQSKKNQEVDEYLDEITDSNNYRLLNDAVLYNSEELKKLKNQNMLLVSANTLLNNKITNLEHDLELKGEVINNLESMLLNLQSRLEVLENVRT